MLSFVIFQVVPLLGLKATRGYSRAHSRGNVLCITHARRGVYARPSASAIMLRELDFALWAHTKVWRLGEQVARPLHLRRALELC
jgi:hypothetical protein